MQKYACIILSIGFLLIQLPSSYIFMFILNLDIYGFWLAMILSEMLTDILLFILIWRFDWNTVSEKALDNIRFSESSEDLKTNPSPLKNTNEHMELLSRKSDEKNDYTKINKDNTKQIQLANEENMYNESLPDKSLFKSIIIKAIILLLLSFMFIVSFINSVTENDYFIILNKT